MNLTRRHQLQLHLNAARGAEYLDANGEFGWPVAIAALFPAIRIAEASNCIVGTLLKQGFINGIAESLGGTIDGYSEWVKAHNVNDRELGFNLPSADDSDANGDRNPMAWSEDLSSEQGWSALMEGWHREALDRLTPEMVDAVARRAVNLQRDLALRLRGTEADQKGHRSVIEEAERARNDLSDAVEDRREELEECAQAAALAERALEDTRRDFRTAEDRVGRLWDEHNELQGLENTLRNRIQRTAELVDALPRLREDADKGWIIIPPPSPYDD